MDNGPVITHDRKLGLEYEIRKHPALTPAAEANGITQPTDPAFDADSTRLSKIDPAWAMISALTRKITAVPEHGVWIVVQPGQRFLRARLLVQSIANLCDANIVICLAEGESLPGKRSLRVGIAANGMPASRLTWVFNRAMVVRSIYTTSGPAAKATATLGGTWAAGQVYGISLQTPDPSAPTSENLLTLSFSYTSVIGDVNFAGTAASIVSAWNATPSLAAVATLGAGVGGGSSVITLTATNAGSLIQQGTLQTTVTAPATFVSNAFAGAANPEAAVAFE